MLDHNESIVHSLLNEKPKLLWPIRYLMQHIQPRLRPVILSSLRTNLQNMLHWTLSDSSLARLLTL
jgi:hypothetical protein